MEPNLAEDQKKEYILRMITEKYPDIFEDKEIEDYKRNRSM